MKQFLAYMIMTLAALWTVGCSDDSLSDDPTDQPERGIVIRLSTGDLETRTDLTSQANLQHVTEVYAVLYEETGDEAAFVSVEKLDWNPSEDGNGFQKEEFTLPKTATDGLSAGSYTILCVGLDDKSGATYGLTLENINNESNGWKTLADAKAALATGKSTDDIAHSELFAGWAEFEFEPDNINIVEVEMKRRVAGVLCYVTDIPTTINTGGVNEPVKKLRLALYTGEKPNNQISLCRKEVEKATDGTIKIPDDFGENNPNPNAAQLTPNSEGYLILKEIDLEHLYNSDGSQTGEIFVIPEIKTDALKVEANSLLLGAYVIPIAATDEKVTLKVELLGEEDQVLATFNAKRDGTSGSESYNYNIYPNYIYHIGDKPEPASTEGDQPASLLGKELTVVPQEWTKMPEVDVDFPSVPLVNGIELVNQDYIPYKEGYIFDCIGIDDDNNESYKDTYYLGAPYDERLYVKVSASILKNRWRLSISDDGAEMLYISKENSDGSYSYVTSYEGDGQADEYVPLLLTSFASSTYQGETRNVTLTLTSFDNDNNPTDSDVTLQVSQYNAFIVYDDENGNRGVSRKDWNNGREIEWGYQDLFAYVDRIFGDVGYRWYDGQSNFNAAKDKNWNGYFYSSAMYYCARKFVTVSGGIKNTNKDWYLPARYELRYFLQQHKNRVSVSNRYWSSSPYGFDLAYYNYIKDDGKVFDESEIDDSRKVINRHKNLYKMRPTCKL